METKSVPAQQLEQAMDRAETHIIAAAVLWRSPEYVRATMRRNLLATGFSTEQTVEADIDALRGVTRPTRSVWQRIRAWFGKARNWSTWP